MKLEQQVCSLELAKKLKKLGVKQESLFYWNLKQDGVWVAGYSKGWSDCISAFTVAELGNLISNVKGIRLDETRSTVMDEWSIAKSETERIYANTEADARAKMLIYLLENNLIK